MLGLHRIFTPGPDDKFRRRMPHRRWPDQSGWMVHGIYEKMTIPMLHTSGHATHFDPFETSDEYVKRI